MTGAARPRRHGRPARPAAARARASTPVRLGRPDRRRRQGPERHREGRQLVELDPVHRRLRGREVAPHARRLHQAVRHQGQLHRGLQRQRRVLRQGAPAPRGRRGHRPRRLVQHRLDGRPPHPPGLRPEARHGQHPQRRRTSSRRSRTSSSTRAASTPCRGRAASPASRYNLDATGGKKIETITQLLTDPALKGKVTLLTEMRDTVGLVLCEHGQGPAPTSPTPTSTPPSPMIQKAKDAGQLKGFTGNDYTDGLTKGDIAACIAWTGDVVQLQFENEKVQYALPAGRLHAVVGQLRHPGARQAQEERRDAHQLLLRPGRHGAGRGVGQLHPAGRGHQGGAGQGRPGDRATTR